MLDPNASTDLFHPSLDLGQLIISVLLAIIGFFIKKELNTLSQRLDKHDSVLLDLVKDVARLVGTNEQNHFGKTR